jgi:hypothetical protein
VKRSLKIVRRLSFKNPLTGRQHSAKETRSHSIVRTFATGGAVPCDLDPISSAGKPKKRKVGGRAMGKHGGQRAGGRLDKRARGGKIEGYDFGGNVANVPRPSLPAQAAPQASAAPAQSGGQPSFAGSALPASANQSAPAYGLLGTAPPQGAPAVGGAPSWAGTALPPQANPNAQAFGLLGTIPPQAVGAGMGRPAWAGTGLPQSNAAANAALAARAGMPSGAMGARPFKRGGGVVGRTVKDLGRITDGYLSGKSDPYSSARKGKK